MLIRIIFVLLLVMTISYWTGYLIGRSINDLRPICFITFGDGSSLKTDGTASVYWGYEGHPAANCNGLQFLAASIDKTDVYFLVDRTNLLKEANGRKVIAVMTKGRFSMRENSTYLSMLFRSGKKFELKGIWILRKTEWKGARRITWLFFINLQKLYLLK